MQESLLIILGAFGCRKIPTPSTLSDVLTGVANFVFLSSPMSAINSINSGIPSNHRSFWSSKSLTELKTIYQALTATPSKVLSLLEEPCFGNVAQEAVFGYLRQYIGNMTLVETRLFLRFVTGSSVCSSQKIDVPSTCYQG